MPLTSISAFKKSHRLENSVCRCSFHHVLERCWWKKRFNGAVSTFCWVTESNYRIHEHQRSLNYSLINELLANPWRGLVVAERGELDWSAQLHTRYTYTEAWTFCVYYSRMFLKFYDWAWRVYILMNLLRDYLLDLQALIEVPKASQRALIGALAGATEINSHQGLICRCHKDCNPAENEKILEGFAERS